jgi:hypothetical protein
MRVSHVWSTVTEDPARTEFSIPKHCCSDVQELCVIRGCCAAGFNCLRKYYATLLTRSAFQYLTILSRRSPRLRKFTPNHDMVVFLLFFLFTRTQSQELYRFGRNPWRNLLQHITRSNLSWRLGGFPDIVSFRALVLPLPETALVVPKHQQW